MNSLKSTLRLLLLTLLLIPLPLMTRAGSQPQVLQTSSPAVRRALQALDSSVAAERVAAILTLRRMGEKAAAAVPALIQRFKDVDEVTLKFSPGGSSNIVVESKTWPAKEAVAALIAIGKPAVQPLLALLNSERDLTIRERAAEALAGIKDPTSVEPLIRLLRDKDGNVDDAIATALGQIKDERAIEPLVKACKDDRSNWVNGALQQITGESFDDCSQWEKWWTQRKARSPRD